MVVGYLYAIKPTKPNRFFTGTSELLVFFTFFVFFFSFFLLSFRWGCRIRRLDFCRSVRPLPQTKPPIGHRWRPVDGVKWSASLDLRGLDEQSEEPDQINWLVNLYDCFWCIFQIALGTNKHPTLFYLQGAWMRWLRVNFAEIALIETIKNEYLILNRIICIK